MEKLLMFCFAALVISAGCTRDDIPMVKDGRVTVNFSVQGEDTLSKALLNEWGIVDVNIYFVDKRGNVITHVYSPSPQPAECEIYTGLEYTVYAIANTGRDIDASTLEELMEMKLYDSYFTTACVPFSCIDGPYVLKNGNNISLVFVRLFSKIRVTADFSQLNEDVSIKIKQIRLRNIPNFIRPFVDSRIASLQEVTDSEPYMNPSDYELGNGVSIYTLENLQGKILEGNTSQSGKVLPEGSQVAKFCSYLELTAEYKSDNKQGDVIYRYYLGKDNVSNFDVARNCTYLLNISFKGNGGVDENTWRVDVKELLLTL